MSLPIEGGLKPLEPDSTEYQTLIKALHDDIGFAHDERICFRFTSLGATASRDLPRGMVVFFDRALCYVDPFLSPEDVPGIRTCVEVFPAKDRKRLNQLFGKGGKDILQFPDNELFNVFNNSGMQLQFPVTRDRLGYALDKLVTGRVNTTKWCMTIPSWTLYLFGHSCAPNAVVVPSPTRMEN